MVHMWYCYCIKTGKQKNVFSQLLGFADAATNPIDFPIAPAFAVPKVSSYFPFIACST